MNFFCFDVETANESASSICQIGIAAFIEGRHKPELDFEMYVDPEDYFLEELISIHGITEEMVSGAPTFPSVHQLLNKVLTGCVVLGHIEVRVRPKRLGLQKRRWPHSPRVL